MRIAILAPYAGYIVGGVENVARNVREHFNLYKYDCKIFSLAETDWTTRVPGIKGSQSPKLIRKLGLNYLNHLTPYIYIIKNNAFSEFSYSYNIYPMLKRFNPDIILNLTFTILALFCKYYRYKFKVPFINFGHAGCTYMEVKSAMTKPDVYVALTPKAKNYIKKRVPGVRVELIPDGVDLDLFSTKGPKFPMDYFVSKSNKPKLDLSRPLILSTSRLVSEKRLDLLIKAVSKLEKGTLILVGQGEAKKRLLNLGHKLLKDRLIFLDTLSQEEISKLYRSCDVFSLPSNNEPFGLVILEAMASGIPVVATDDEGFRWIVGDKGGILVDVSDIQLYANALYEAYEKNFEDGPEKQAQKFSWQIVAQKYNELIKSVSRAKR